jgi:uncharacterized protein
MRDVESVVESLITIRRPPLEFPAGLDPVVIAGCPEESFMFVGLSLLVPYLEPYLIRSMRAAQRHVTDPRLRADLEGFSGQEGQHYKQHMRFNEALGLAGFGGLAALEAEVAEDYRRYTRSKSLRWNLAYAEGFEAFTTALARYALESRWLERLEPSARELFKWHLVEELEHRTVAFDVYENVSGGYLYRLVIGLFAQWHLSRFIRRVVQVMVNTDPEVFRQKYGGELETRARMGPRFAQMRRLFLPKLLATYLPWYTPHRIPMPAAARAAADGYTALSAAK